MKEMIHENLELAVENDKLKRQLDDARRAISAVLAAIDEVNVMADSVDGSKDAPIEKNPFYLLGAITRVVNEVTFLARRQLEN
jgi:hypothetical protein